MKALRSWGEHDETEWKEMRIATLSTFVVVILLLTNLVFNWQGLVLMVGAMVTTAIFPLAIPIVRTTNPELTTDEVIDYSFDLFTKFICVVGTGGFAIYQLTLHANRDELMVLGLMVGLYLLGSLKSWGVMWFYHRVNRLFKVNA